MKYSFFPGCTLHSTGIEYGLSTHAVCHALGIEMMELPDWNCCGASSAHSLDYELSYALPARNVLIAQQFEADMAVPCAACYGHSAAADARLREDRDFREKMERTLELKYEGRGRPRSLLDIFANDVPSAEIKARIKKPLTGLKPVSYYGCLLIRPPKLTGRWDDPEHPVLMDRLLSLLGAEPLPWSYAVDCCGASLTLNRSDVVVTLSGRLVDAAEEAGANCIVTACPLCMANLDGRQKRAKPIPIFYFTELIGLAFDIPEASKWFGKHMINPAPLLKSLGLASF